MSEQILTYTSKKHEKIESVALGMLFFANATGKEVSTEFDGIFFTASPHERFEDVMKNYYSGVADEKNAAKFDDYFEANAWKDKFSVKDINLIKAGENIRVM